MKRLDITGQVFNRLTALRVVERREDGRIIWEFKCACGNTHRAQAKSVRAGETKSCGCWRRVVGFELGKSNRGRHYPKSSLRSRFKAHVEFSNRPMPTACAGFGPCLLWTGSLDTNGYALLGVEKVLGVEKETGFAAKHASHVAWFLAHGCWPKYLCHRCDNPACVEVTHLFEGNDGVNQYDAQMKQRGYVQVPVPSTLVGLAYAKATDPMLVAA
jgi:hypothetical protein